MGIAGGGCCRPPPYIYIRIYIYQYRSVKDFALPTANHGFSVLMWLCIQAIAALPVEWHGISAARERIMAQRWLKVAEYEFGREQSRATSKRVHFFVMHRQRTAHCFVSTMGSFFHRYIPKHIATKALLIMSKFDNIYRKSYEFLNSAEQGAPWCLEADPMQSQLHIWRERCVKVFQHTFSNRGQHIRLGPLQVEQPGVSCGKPAAIHHPQRLAMGTVPRNGRFMA